MNRREFLRAAPSAAIVGVGSVCAASALAQPSETPVMIKFREWQAYTVWLKDVQLPDDEWEAAVQVQTDMEDDLLVTPAENARDILAKLAAYSIYGEGSVPTGGEGAMFWGEVRALVA